MTWAEISEYVLQLPHQQDVLVPKESVVPPEVGGIPYTWGGYRRTLRDGRATDIKKHGNCYRVHWDWHNPGTRPIEHGLRDAPGELLLFTTLGGAAIRALTSPEGERGKASLRGCAEGLGFGLLVLLLGEIARKN